MAGDESSRGDDDLGAGAARGDLGAGAARSDLGAGAAPEGPVAGAAPGDPVAAEVRALFAAALADEPDSAVTPLAVLLAAKRERADFRRRRVVRIRRWGGAAVVAAAAVAAVVVLGPGLAGRSGTTSAGGGTGPQAALASAQAQTSAAAGNVAATNGVATEAAAGQAGGGSSGGQAGGQAGGADTRRPPAGGAVEPASPAASGEPCGEREPACDAQSVPQTKAGADTDRVTTEPGASVAAGAASTEPAESGTGGAGAGCPVRAPLSPGEIAAVISAVPGGTVQDGPRVSSCAPDPLRASVVHAPWPGAVLIVAVAPAGAGVTGPTDALMAPGATPIVAIGRASGGAVVVTVTANPAAVDRLTQAQLDSIASSVLAATR